MTPNYLQRQLVYITESNLTGRRVSKLIKFTVMALGNGIMTKISGSAGNLTFRIRGGEQVISGRIQKISNPKTILQVNQRIKFPNIVATYRAFHGLLKEGFEKKRRGRRNKDMSDFNRFMSVNLQSAPVYLTRSESAAGYCIAAPYQITEGTLVPISTQGVETDTYSDIALGELEITDETTIEQFAEAVVTNNPLYEYGDAISYFSVLQNVEVDTGIPYVTVNQYKVTLDTADHTPLRSVAPSFGFSVSNGFLAHGENIGQGAFAWVHTRRGSEGLLVSSQRLIVANALFEEYNSNSAKSAARRTYGSVDVALEPGTSDDFDSATGPIASMVTVAGIVRLTGGRTFAIAKDDKVVLEGSRLGGTGAVQVLYGTSDQGGSENKLADLTVASRTNNSIEATIPEEAAGYCYGFYVAPRMVAVYVGKEQNPGGGGGEEERPGEL